MNAIDALVGSLTRAPARRIRVYRVAPVESAMTRCEPLAHHCPQEGRCARAAAMRGDGRVVDASICLEAGQCPMFIDTRAAALLAS